MTREPLVLLVDDEAAIRGFVRTAVVAQGWRCEEAATADAALTLALSLAPDLVVLDLGLPDGEGFDVLVRLRQTSSVPIVVLSARARESDKVEALEAGADDYVTKPFGPAELISRIKGIWRRSGASVAEAEPQRFGTLVWDPAARRVFVGDREVHLTPVEYRLFGALAQKPGRILTHAWLLQTVWGRTSSDLTHYVRIALAGLRRKLEPTAESPRFIHTEVGVGYRFFE